MKPASNSRRKTTSVLTLNTRASCWTSPGIGAWGWCTARSSSKGISNSAATRLHQRSVCCSGTWPACVSDTPVAPSQRWASSWASVNICAALLSPPFRNTSGARPSASAKPRNSATSSLRWLLLPTTELTITITPASSACAINWRRASVQLGNWRRVSVDSPSAWRRRCATAAGDSCMLALPTNGRTGKPCMRAWSRYQSCRCWHR